MPVERSAGAVIFRETKKGRAYLLLQHEDRADARAAKRVPGHWDFSKGHLEKGETGEDAARREIKEETKIVIARFIPGFKETIRYFVKAGEERRLKFVVFFLAQTRGRKVALAMEHRGYAWLAYKDAHRRLTYANAKVVLKKAEYFLHKKGAT